MAWKACVVGCFAPADSDSDSRDGESGDSDDGGAGGGGGDGGGDASRDSAPALVVSEAMATAALRPVAATPAEFVVAVAGVEVLDPLAGVQLRAGHAAHAVEDYASLQLLLSASP